MKKFYLIKKRLIPNKHKASNKDEELIKQSCRPLETRSFKKIEVSMIPESHMANLRF